MFYQLYYRIEKSAEIIIPRINSILKISPIQLFQTSDEQLLKNKEELGLTSVKSKGTLETLRQNLRAKLVSTVLIIAAKSEVKF